MSHRDQLQVLSTAAPCVSVFIDALDGEQVETTKIDVLSSLQFGIRCTFSQQPMENPIPNTFINYIFTFTKHCYLIGNQMTSIEYPIVFISDVGEHSLFALQILPFRQNSTCRVLIILHRMVSSL